MIITLLNICCKWKFTDTLHIFYEVLAFKKLHVYQMIINEVKPDLIIEIGTYIGGNAL